MKKLFFILFTITTVFAFTACGSDDDNRKPVTFEGSCNQTLNIKGFEGQVSKTNPAVVSKVSDMLISNPNYGSPITEGEFYTVGTSIKITGLKPDITLKNFTLTINGVSQSFGDVKLPLGAPDYQLFTSLHQDFFRNGFNKMMSKKQLETIVEFTPSSDIIAEDNVKLEILYFGKFTYLK